ncbi:hypothetical protein F511_20623 [Dorcoceras hygrometricum]|uniref:Uncharacterized protein n=1 Tax=Dorcoceras hygrometricum TaxID=472368 RepID=A0A2Z7CEF8_9LAMI|nr:hypothetical protein F511_20623 [Dorcoceras hygrometricum]
MDQQMREFRVTSCWFGKTVEEVERRRFVKLKRCVLEPASRGFLAIARRCRLKKSIRQRFAFTLKDSADGLCDDLKPADSYSYLESADRTSEFSTPFEIPQLEKQQAHAEKPVFVVEFLHRLKASAVFQIVTVRFHSSFVRNFQTSCIRVLAKVEYSCALEPSRFHLADHCLRKFRLNYLCSFKFCVALISLSLYGSTEYSAL